VEKIVRDSELIASKFLSFIDAMVCACRSSFYGFVQGHFYLTQRELSEIAALVNSSDRAVVRDFEKKFASIVGDGGAITFASGRMGFYEVMRYLGVGVGDEVILLGSTCAVMANAVFRLGATPIFSDIDPNTFGSSVEEISQRISVRTKMIVAQHSFGIPCDIESIVEFAKSKNIFLLEDCALTFGSTVNGICVGNFGDAALFSTDHSKPINTLIGGLIYTKNWELLNTLCSTKYPELSLSRKRAVMKRLALERRLANPSNNGLLKLLTSLGAMLASISLRGQPFLLDDSGFEAGNSYPYPASFPAFLAKLGLKELERWEGVSAQRKKFLQSFLKIATEGGFDCRLPRCYFDKRLDIYPLRIAWCQPEASQLRVKLSKFLDVSWFWFMQPIVSTSLPLEAFGYTHGSCPKAEEVGLSIINLPCSIQEPEFYDLMLSFKKSMRG
jgi:dTDP-4-amino-4,6-dideoxygalactose transaminase